MKIEYKPKVKFTNYGPVEIAYIIKGVRIPKKVNMYRSFTTGFDEALFCPVEDYPGINFNTEELREILKEMEKMNAIRSE